MDHLPLASALSGARDKNTILLAGDDRRSPDHRPLAKEQRVVGTGATTDLYQLQPRQPGA
jgi:hypothetical protein